MDLNEFIIKFHFFTKEITNSGGQKVITIPNYENDNFDNGDKVLIIKLKKTK